MSNFDNFYNKYLKYKFKYTKLKYNNILNGGKFNCNPTNEFNNICLENKDGKYRTKDSCINDCENQYIKNQLEKINIRHETTKFYLFIKDIITNEKIEVYLKGGNVLGLKILKMIYDKYKNNDKKFKECFDEFLKLDLIKDWDLTGYSNIPITEEYRKKLDKIARKYKLVPRAKTFILYQTDKPILLDDKPLFEISILDKDTFSKLELPLTTMKIQVNEYNLKYIFMLCKEFYSNRLNQEKFDFNILKRLLSKINIKIHPHKNGIYKVENNFDKGKLNDNLLDFIKSYSKNDINLQQFLATQIEDPYRMLYRLVSKNIKKNNNIKDFLKNNLNIRQEWLFDDKWIIKHINDFTEKLGNKIADIYINSFNKSKDIISSLSDVADFLTEISFNRVKSDYDTFENIGIKILENIFSKLLKSINKEELKKIEIRSKFIDFLQFLSDKI